MTLDEHAEFISRSVENWDVSENTTTSNPDVIVIEGISATRDRFFSFQIGCADRVFVLFPEGMASETITPSDADVILVA